MKSILLATAASVAFAGAAAAEVTFSGEASAAYNNNTGLDVQAELKAAMSAALDNGYTASAGATFDVDAGTFKRANVSISSDVASLTFGTALNGAAYTVVSDTYGVGLGEEKTNGLLASYKIGETTVYASLPVAQGAKADLNTLELGAKTTVSGWTVSAAAAKVAGKNEFAAKFSGAVAGATISGGFGTVDKGGKANQWDIKAEYPVGPVTVSAAYDEASVYVLGAKYSANGVTVAAEYTKGGAWKADASYAYGSGVNVFAGLAEKGNDIYVGATYDLGAGATLTGSYVKDGGAADADNKIGAKDYARGATVKVSFKF
ncbi:porin [Marivivens sp. LCG002]|uniref:porin n=1 Tax=Marivivens sp. LCG002 TaxID=3051171 RepID=UPI002556AFF6|nr:porin [Marivivens sp. LCG002]WIV50652.1 porin [Marivivens sp. LCG002]